MINFPSEMQDFLRAELLQNLTRINELLFNLHEMVFNLLTDDPTIQTILEKFASILELE